MAMKKQLHRLYRLMDQQSAQAAVSDQTLKELAASFDIDADQLRDYLDQQQRESLQLAASAKDQDTKNRRPLADLETQPLQTLLASEHPDLVLAAKLELARRDFFAFCSLRAPDFYRADRAFLVRLCGELQAFYESTDTVLVVNLPPRHGKSRTAGLFEQWMFGQKPAEKIMTGSYNETLSTTFSKTVRDGINETKAAPDKIVYRDIFPGVSIKRGDGAMNLWSLEGQYSSYLATSPDGTATGFGASVIVIDDLIKSAYEAFNDTILDNHWSWFTNTMLSRLENGGKIIIIMTRWASKDLAGRAVAHFVEHGVPCRVLSMQAVVDEQRQQMLCPEILSYQDYKMKSSAMAPEIVAANYQQEPIDVKGRLYQSFRTYTDIPRNDKGHPLFTSIKAYVDTADTGSDYLCCIIYGEYQKEAYVLDVYYTKDQMETTEPETAKRLHLHDVREADIESNNGGRGFARAVEQKLRIKHRSNRCKVRWFHQSQNKRSRILTNATWVQEHIYFPVNWRDRWPEYYDAMQKYQKEGKNAHDDAPDATTGVAEKIGHRGGVSILK